jgi:hypothetical protein
MFIMSDHFRQEHFDIYVPKLQKKAKEIKIKK